MASCGTDGDFNIAITLFGCSETRKLGPKTLCDACDTFIKLF
jgi:hypothetical protein